MPDFRKTLMTAFFILTIILTYSITTPAIFTTNSTVALTLTRAKISRQDTESGCFLYYPAYCETSPETAVLFASLFQIYDNFQETEDYYSFSDASRFLTVYKHISRVSLTAAEMYSKTQISLKKALKVAAEYAELYCLTDKLRNATVTQEGDGFLITFSDAINNMENIAFVNKIKLSRDGELLFIDYYYISYEQLKSYPLKTVSEALSELPPVENLEIFQSRLVYVYKSSVLQPAYIFTGTIAYDKPYKALIRASKF